MENSKELISNGDKIERNPDGTLKKGSVLNPKGRGEALGFATKFKLFIDRLADSNGISAEAVEEQLFNVAYKKAKEGDYSFYRDIFDRLYGKPTQVIENKDITQTENIIDILKDLKKEALRDSDNEKKDV